MLMSVLQLESWTLTKTPTSACAKSGAHMFSSWTSLWSACTIVASACRVFAAAMGFAKQANLCRIV